MNEHRHHRRANFPETEFSEKIRLDKTKKQIRIGEDADSRGHRPASSPRVGAVGEDLQRGG